MNFRQFALSVMLLVVAFTSNAQNTQEIITEKINTWAKFESHHDTSALAVFYAPTVRFYGKSINKSGCLKNLSDLFKKYPDFKVEIKQGIKFSDLTSTNVRVDFIKNVTYNKAQKTFKCYFTFTNIEGVWKIIEESDVTTDANLSIMKSKLKKSTERFVGDFDGDGRKDTAVLYTPEFDESGIDCKGDCKVIIRFPNRSFPDITIENCITLTLENLGDINGNKTEEFGCIPLRLAGCWNPYYSFTLLNNKWEPLVPVFSTHCNQFEQSDEPAIQKDPKKNGYALITYSDMDVKNEIIVTKSKSVLMRR